MSKKNPYKREIPKGMVACGGVLRLYPDSNQIQQLFQNFGNCRFVFNRYKATFDERYENNPDLKVPDKYALEKLLPCLKQKFNFLKLTDSTALQITVDIWQQAQMDFITRKTKNQGKPKFKNKNYYRQSYSIKSNKKKHKDGTVTMTIGIIDDTHVSLPKIGLIKTSNTASFRNYRILRATISWRQDLNRFYISFNGLKPRPKQNLFRRILTYECQWYSKKLIVVPPQYTSRTCSACGQRNCSFTGMKTNEWLAIREWTCPFCHAHHDRDINAAKNILYKGIRQAD